MIPTCMWFSNTVWKRRERDSGPLPLPFHALFFLLFFCQSNFAAASAHVQDPSHTAGGPCTRNDGLPQQLVEPSLGGRRLLCPHGWETSRNQTFNFPSPIFLHVYVVCLPVLSLPQVWLIGEYANTSYDSRCSANELSMFFEVRDTASTTHFILLLIL